MLRRRMYETTRTHNALPVGGLCQHARDGGVQHREAGHLFAQRSHVAGAVQRAQLVQLRHRLWNTYNCGLSSAHQETETKDMEFSAQVFGFQNKANSSIQKPVQR
jgi:hypothetical protein